MTTVEILKDREGYTYAFKFKGHAGYDDNGKDIVCAGISMASQMAIVFLQQKICDLKVEQGDGSLEFKFFEFRHFSEVTLMCRTLELVLKDLEEQYPENIHVLAY